MPYKLIGNITIFGERTSGTQTVDRIVRSNDRAARDMCWRNGMDPDETEIHFGINNAVGYTAKTEDEMGEANLMHVFKDYIENRQKQYDLVVGVYIKIQDAAR